MTPDEQQAGSIRYVAGLLVVALDSGSWAIYSRHAEELLAIVPGLAKVEDSMRRWQREAEELRERRRGLMKEKLERERKNVITGKSLADLGL